MLHLLALTALYLRARISARTSWNFMSAKKARSLPRTWSRDSRSVLISLFNFHPPPCEQISIFTRLTQYVLVIQHI